MTYWESKTRVYAIDGLRVVSCIVKSSLKFTAVEYSNIDWTALEEISKAKFDAFRLEAIELMNDKNRGFND